jgi:hypothetical protein
LLDHGYSHEDWLAFLDGTLAEEQRTRLIGHARECDTCAATLAGFAQWEQMLAAEAADSRLLLKAADERVQRLTARILERIHEPADARSATDREFINEALDTLRAVLIPICGLNAVETTLRVAAERTSGAGLNRVGTPNWREFVVSLSSIVASYCGITPARLVIAAAPRLEGEIAS